MTPERYQQVKSAFRLALEVPAESREQFLRRQFPSDPALLADVLALLESDAEPATPLDRPAVGSHFRLRMLSLSYTAARQ